MWTSGMLNFFVVFSMLNDRICFCSGVVATVFGATGFLGRYVVSQLGTDCYIKGFALLPLSLPFGILTYVVVISTNWFTGFDTL